MWLMWMASTTMSSLPPRHYRYKQDSRAEKTLQSGSHVLLSVGMSSREAGPSTLADVGEVEKSAATARYSNSAEDAQGDREQHNAISAETESDLNGKGNAAHTAASESGKPLPPIFKRKGKRPPKGILKASPAPSKAFSFRRDVLQQLNSRLAQQGVNVQVPVPPAGSALGSFTETAQGTAQAAGSILGGMFKRVSGLASGAAQAGDDGQGFRRGARLPQQGSTPISRTGRSEARGGNVSGAASARPRESSPTPSQSSATNNLPQPSASVRPLRRVRFSPGNLSVVYPISGAIAPGDEDATRQRVEEEHRKRMQDRLGKQWDAIELEALYRDCCRMREEHPLKKMRGIFQAAAQANPPVLRMIDLSFVPLDRQAIEPISDLLSVDFGLQKLMLENCGLTDDGVKSILHALLVSGTLPNLSLASNKRIKYHGWRFVGIFMRRAKALRNLDLSENNINRASLDHIIGALGHSNGSNNGKAHVTDDYDDEGLTISAKLLMEDTAEVSHLSSLRLENCGLKSASLESLAHNVRNSSLSHLSLRRNRINQMGAVALALMLKDYPDQLSSTAEQVTAPQEASYTAEAPYAVRTSPRINEFDRATSADGSPVSRRSYSTVQSASPLIVSSPGGGVTRRSIPKEALESLQDASNSPIRENNAQSNLQEIPPIEMYGEAAKNGAEDVNNQPHSRYQESLMAIHQAKRAKQILASMPKSGNLLTLDLKSNDIRSGVIYLSQSLKKNRTLKVLNLSDNNVEVAGLVALADALKYNSTLETLDLSHNPCCGPGLEGITTLRTAFALESRLKRLFLSDTDLSSEGAIALAEFLPEAKSLIHLDLTDNLTIDIAGVMALAASIKMNKSLRCLDLSIPPNAPDFARLSQDILSSCVRNTEYAQRRAQQRGIKGPIAAPIYKSSLARIAKEKEERARLREATRQLEMEGASETSAISRKQQPRTREEIQVAVARTIDAGNECATVMRELLMRERDHEKERLRDREAPVRPDGTIERQASDFGREMMTQSTKLRNKLRNLLGVMEEGDDLVRALQVNEDLQSISKQVKDFYDGQTDIGDVKTDAMTTPEKSTRAPRRSASLSPGASSSRLDVPSVRPLDDGLSSPNFSIGSDDSDVEDGPSSKARLSQKRHFNTDQGDIVQGLGIGTTETEDEEAKAAREIPLESEEGAVDEDSEAALVNSKAKGQLSEEGEIFRRAKSLSLVDEDENADRMAEGNHQAGEENRSERAAELENVRPDSDLRINTHDLQPSAVRATSFNSASKTSPSHSFASPIEDRTDVSGEELRRELLEAGSPRKSTSPAISPNTGDKKSPFVAKQE